MTTPPRSVMLLESSEVSISLVSRVQLKDPSDSHAQCGAACMNAVRGAGWSPRPITRRRWDANPSASRPVFGMIIISSLDEAGSVEYTCRHTPGRKSVVHEMFSLYLTRTRSSQHPVRMEAFMCLRRCSVGAGRLLLQTHTEPSK